MPWYRARYTKVTGSFAGNNHEEIKAGFESPSDQDALREAAKLASEDGSGTFALEEIRTIRGENDDPVHLVKNNLVPV